MTHFTRLRNDPFFLSGYLFLFLSIITSFQDMRFCQQCVLSVQLITRVLVAGKPGLLLGREVSLRACLLLLLTPVRKELFQRVMVSGRTKKGSTVPLHLFPFRSVP